MTTALVILLFAIVVIAIREIEHKGRKFSSQMNDYNAGFRAMTGMIL